MDLSKLAGQVKNIQRRTTQKVLQSVGMADKTEDESQAYQNFLALGSFASQLKTTIQAADGCFEKACTAQTHLAGQIQSYLSSELSGDGDLPPGELNEFFNSSDATRLHAETLQQISGKFYHACSELGNNALQAVLGQLDDLVLRPIINDEEFAPMTKEIMDEKKRSTLDYDSYRRTSGNNPSEHEAKLRSSRDRFEQASRRAEEHINVRNQLRCKLLVHGILTAIQQYCNFYNHAINIFRDTALSLKPLLEVYQLSEAQLQTALNLHELSQDPNLARSPPKNAASSVFDDYAAQQNNHKPKASVSKTSAAAAPARVTSPQIDDMMRDNTLNLAAKPAAQPLKNTPMNQYGTNKASPQPVHHAINNNSQPIRHASPQPTSNNAQIPRTQSPAPAHQPPPQPQPPQPQQPPVDLFGTPSHQPRVQSPQEDILVDLNASSNDLLGGSFGGSFAPPMQPSNADPFATFVTPSPVSPTPSKPPAQPQQQQTKPTTPTPPSDDLLFASPITPSRPGSAPVSNDPFAAFSPPGNSNNKKPLDDFDNLFGTPTPQPQQQQRQPPKAQPATFGGAPPSSAGGASVGATGAGNKQKQEERHELNPAVTNKINNWASRGGRQTNLRALLSTLHEVIWVDSGWDALSLADLVTSAQVKKAYVRANLIVHPDKIQNGTVEQQLMAQRIFEALRVSYETFKDEPK